MTEISLYMKECQEKILHKTLRRVHGFDGFARIIFISDSSCHPCHPCSIPRVPFFSHPIFSSVSGLSFLWLSELIDWVR